MIFDNCTKALIKVYEREHRKKPPEKRDFTKLVEHLTTCEDACFHFFYCKIFEADIESSGSQCLLKNVRDKCDTFSQVDFTDPGMKVWVNGKVSPIVRDESSDGFILKRPRKRGENVVDVVVYKANDIHRSVHNARKLCNENYLIVMCIIVLIATKIHRSVCDVREIRNDLAHCKQVWITDDCLKKLYESVKEAYQLMEMKDEIILQQLEDIMSGGWQM